MTETNTLIGSYAPVFTLPDDKNVQRSLQDLLAQGALMLVFYPNDFTLVCTKQLCSYQNVFDQFASLGIQIVGVSHNSIKSHVEFRERYKFNFPLLSDPDKKVFKEYGVTSLFMFGGTSRAVFIISKRGTILYRHVEATILTHRKVPELLEVLTVLNESKML
jgi:peroxiredoxin Q/BCP